MPLNKSRSPKAFSKNVEAEMHAGKPQKQALAIAYAVKRRAKKYAKGGVVGPQDKWGTDKLSNESKSVQRYMDDEQSIGKLDREEHESHAAPSNMEEHDQDMEAQARRDGLKHYAAGGYVSGGDDQSNPDAEMMEGDPAGFLSDEDDLESPFHSSPSDETELKEMYGSSYDKLSDLDNEEGNEDQAQSRKGVLDKIMRGIRMRNMGR